MMYKNVLQNFRFMIFMSKDVVFSSKGTIPFFQPDKKKNVLLKVNFAHLENTRHCKKHFLCKIRLEYNKFE